jgi:hypothetical protein
MEVINAEHCQPDWMLSHADLSVLPIYKHESMKHTKVQAMVATRVPWSQMLQLRTVKTLIFNREFIQNNSNKPLRAPQVCLPFLNVVVKTESSNLLIQTGDWSISTTHTHLKPYDLT